VIENFISSGSSSVTDMANKFVVSMLYSTLNSGISPNKWKFFYGIINIVKHILFIEFQKQETDDDLAKLLDNRIFIKNSDVQKKNGYN